MGLMNVSIVIRKDQSLINKAATAKSCADIFRGGATQAHTCWRTRPEQGGATSSTRILVPSACAGRSHFKHRHAGALALRGDESHQAHACWRSRPARGGATSNTRMLAPSACAWRSHFKHRHASALGLRGEEPLKAQACWRPQPARGRATSSTGMLEPSACAGRRHFKHTHAGALSLRVEEPLQAHTCWRHRPAQRCKEITLRDADQEKNSGPEWVITDTHYICDPEELWNSTAYHVQISGTLNKTWSTKLLRNWPVKWRYNFKTD
jgi:hypothetical protein